MSPDGRTEPAQTGDSGSVYAFAVAFVAAVGGFLFGYDLAIIGAANLYLRDVFQLSEWWFGFTTGSAALGCMAGPFLGGWLCDAIGRNRTLVIACVLLAINAVFTALAGDFITFNVFRIIGGVGVGLCSVASPMYISEVAPKRMRGGLGVMYQLAIVVGSIAAPFAAWIIVKTFPESVAWRWMFGSAMLPILIFAVLLLFLPSSPRWLAGRGRFDEALDVLSRVGGTAHANEELREIKSALAEETGDLRELFQPGIRYALFIGLCLAFFNNWTGWSVMGGYIPRLFEMSGMDDRSQAILQFAVAYGFMGLVTLIAGGLVDRVGRRPLWLCGSALMAAITAITGIVFHFQVEGFLVLVVIILCTVPHGLALGPLPWLMMSEIFPTRLRAKAVAITTAFLWLTIYSGAQLFPILTGFSAKVLGSEGGAFWLFSVICVAALLFGWKMLPETKGRTLEEISRSWKKL